MNEGWSDKLKEQAGEGCNIAGKVRVNKVVGNIHLSPGRSFRTAAQNIYDLVPYLREDGNRHDFSHTIHELAFDSEDESDLVKAKMGQELKRRMGISGNPLDGALGRVGVFVSSSRSQVTPNLYLLQTAKQQYMFQYFLKVVSTQFRLLDGKSVNIVRVDRLNVHALIWVHRSILTSTVPRTSSGTLQKAIRRTARKVFT